VVDLLDHVLLLVDLCVGFGLVGVLLLRLLHNIGQPLQLCLELGDQLIVLVALCAYFLVQLYFRQWYMSISVAWQSL
jgi:hypothetical protein